MKLTARVTFNLAKVTLKRIIVHLQLPEVIIVPTHADRVLIVEAICLILHHLSYPCRWFDLQNQFGSALSCIFYYTIHLILQRVKHGVLFFNVSMENLQSFVDVFASHGVPEVIKLFAVIHVKKHNICKPTRHQRSMYSGHKRVHCVKYQTLEAPNGW